MVCHRNTRRSRFYQPGPFGRGDKQKLRHRTVGDEFDLMNPAAGRDVVEGTLQVVGVSEETSAARITHMVDAVFRQGVVVRLVKKMR